MSNVDLDIYWGPTQSSTLEMIKAETSDCYTLGLKSFENKQEKLLEMISNSAVRKAIFVYGNRGSGKSQMIRTIGMNLSRDGSDKKIPILVNLGSEKTSEAIRKRRGSLETTNIGYNDLMYLVGIELATILEAMQEGKGDTEIRRIYKVQADRLNDYENGNLLKVLIKYCKSSDFDLATVLSKINGITGEGNAEVKKALSFVLIVDDLDKRSIPENIAMFSDGQREFQSLLSAGDSGRLQTIFCVRPEVMSLNDPGMNYIKNKEYEVEIPSLNDITPQELMDFVKLRICHVHQDHSGNWKFQPDQPANFTSIKEAVKKIQCADVSGMQDNASILYLKRLALIDGDDSIRDFLKALQRVMNNKTISKVDPKMIKSMFTEANEQHQSLIREVLELILNDNPHLKTKEILNQSATVLTKISSDTKAATELISYIGLYL